MTERIVTTDDTPLYTETLIESAIPRVACPKCGGNGEIAINPTRNEWGVWDADFRQCHICEGCGVLPSDVAAEYRAYLEEMDDE